MAAPGCAEEVAAAKAGVTGRRSGRTLLVRHLPAELTAVEKEELLRHFGAVSARVLSDHGRLVGRGGTGSDRSGSRRAIARRCGSGVLPSSPSSGLSRVLIPPGPLRARGRRVSSLWGLPRLVPPWSGGGGTFSRAPSSPVQPLSRTAEGVYISLKCKLQALGRLLGSLIPTSREGSFEG